MNTWDHNLNADEALLGVALVGALALFGLLKVFFLIFV